MRQRAWNVFLVASGVSFSSAALFIKNYDGAHQKISPRHRLHRKTTPVAKASIQETKDPSRTYTTELDKYYAQHDCLPKPKVVHASICREHRRPKNEAKNILVIGDVHGCLEELLLLHEAAFVENDNIPFEYVILVGDMCNKGPYSANVIQYVRNQERWLAVRGNHDDGALAAALGDLDRRKKKTYHWVTNRDPSTGDAMLSDDDVLWLSELPYTLRIPGSLLGESIDTVIVHAGLIPNF